MQLHPDFHAREKSAAGLYIHAAVRPGAEHEYIMHVDASKMREESDVMRRVWSHWEASEPVVITGVVPGVSWDPNVSVTSRRGRGGVRL